MKLGCVDLGRPVGCRQRLLQIPAFRTKMRAGSDFGGSRAFSAKTERFIVLTNTSQLKNLRVSVAISEPTVTVSTVIVERRQHPVAEAIHLRIFPPTQHAAEHIRRLRKEARHPILRLQLGMLPF